jgi:hypothetical protein
MASAFRETRERLNERAATEDSDSHCTTSSPLSAC